MKLACRTLYIMKVRGRLEFSWNETEYMCDMPRFHELSCDSLPQISNTQEWNVIYV
jgi:hypothetical protein